MHTMDNQWLTVCPRPYPQHYRFHDAESGTLRPTSSAKLYSDIIPLLSDMVTRKNAGSSDREGDTDRQIPLETLRDLIHAYTQAANIMMKKKKAGFRARQA